MTPTYTIIPATDPPVYVLVFSRIRECAGPFGSDIVTEREVESPYLATLQAIAGPLEAAGFVCMTWERQRNGRLGPVRIGGAA